LEVRSIEHQISHRYVDVFSPLLSHDGLFVSQCLDRVLRDYVPAGTERVIMWSDGGPHFRCAEVMHAQVVATQAALGIPVDINFFCENHGKNFIDGHFGLISRLMDSHEDTDQISTIADLIRLVRESKEFAVCEVDPRVQNAESGRDKRGDDATMQRPVARNADEESVKQRRQKRRLQ
jgi:hypothetical protein